MSRLATRFAAPTQYRADRPLTNEEMRAVAPSIFATDAHHSRSERYSFVPTVDVLAGLRREGFEPFMVGQSRTRIADKREFTKHMLRFRRVDQINGDEANEVILINSHDGTSSYQMLSGMFRFVCMNGLVLGDVQNDIRIHHKGNIVDDVIEGAFTVVDTFAEIEEQRAEMKALPLLPSEVNAFAEAALHTKYEPDPVTGAFPITAAQLLRPRRWEDDSRDLWSTFNRVQENVIKGGISSRTATNRRTRTREIAGIDQNVKVNRALWQLAQSMQALKAAA
jgi:hypothetical protein